MGLGVTPCKVEGDPSPSLLQGWGRQAGWDWHSRLDCSDGLMGMV